MSQPASMVVPVNLGLNLADPVSSLPPGKLIRAQNLRSDAWGPRHANKYVDRATRGRAHPELDGTNDFVSVPYISEQMDLGSRFTLDYCLHVTALPSADPAWLLGRDEATDQSLDLYLNTDGTVSVRLEDSTSTATTVTSTSGASLGDDVHIRVTRNGTTVNLYYNTTLEATSAVLGANASMFVLDGDLWFGKTPGYGTGEWFEGRVCGVYLRSFVDTDFTYAFSELPGPRGAEVLGAWTCELLDSDATVFDASVFGNHGIVTGASSGSRVVEAIEPVQAMTHMTLRDGQLYNLILVGGRLYVERV